MIIVLENFGGNFFKFQNSVCIWFGYVLDTYDSDTDFTPVYITVIFAKSYSK